jgi:hypothetical protein
LSFLKAAAFLVRVPLSSPNQKDADDEARQADMRRIVGDR